MCTCLCIWSCSLKIGGVFDGPDDDAVRGKIMDLEFEWDEDKRISNIEERGVDFIDAALIFEGPASHNKGGHARKLRRATISSVGKSR